MGAKKTILGDGKKRTRDVIGGLYGEISTAELVKYRTQYDAYAVDENAAGREPKSPTEWMREQKAKSKAD